jgi:zinc finger protein 830
MADVRALLKAKRQEARITHPYAAYSANGALRCTACGAAVKFASAWEGHLGSKAHRIAVAKLRAQEDAVTLRRAKDEKAGEREGADGRDELRLDMIMETDSQPPPTKRQRTEEREHGLDAHAHASRPAFPADFFSDPSRAPLLRRDDDDDDDDDEDMDEDREEGRDGRDSAAPRRRRPSAPAPAPAPETKPSQSRFDAEWAAFERDMQSRQSPPSNATAIGGSSEAASDPQETYARATIAAEPELVPQFEGLPRAAGGTGIGVPGAVVAEVGQAQGQVQEHKVSEEQERRRRQLEENELIMDRLLEEERVQEEADSRVAVLKSRVEMLKKKRQLAGKARGNKADAARI